VLKTGKIPGKMLDFRLSELKIKSPLLYQLSYASDTGLVAARSRTTTENETRS